MAGVAPCITLNNGLLMPILGLGTSDFTVVKGHPVPSPKLEGLQKAVEDAIDIGYRHIDTALFYQNEVEVGKAIEAKITDGTVKREDLFVTTKLWSTYHHPERVLEGLKRSLDNLKLDYVDNFLIHAPATYRFVDHHVFMPKTPAGRPAYDQSDHEATWKEMERAIDMGLARGIGLSNFNQEQIQNILDHCRIKPANLQVEGHAYLMQNHLFDFCKQNKIAVTAYAPLGSPTRMVIKNGQPMATDESDEPVLLQEPAVLEIAKHHSKTPSQILIRYLLQKGRLAIPRSKQRAHLQENMDVFDIELSGEELNRLDSLERGIRYFPHTIVVC